MSIRRFAPVALAAALAAGCGSGDETDYYALTPVTGTVTVDGEPLAGAKIIFTPSGNVPDTPGSDVTGKSGNYKIMYRGRAGVAKGKYCVSIGKTTGEVAVEDGAVDESAVFSEERAIAAMHKAAQQSAAFVKKGGKKTRPVVVGGTFDREVGDAAAVLDFDLKKP